ncbi:hypothetical protein OESDEN_21068, partial [Oesophagostomum dentatum]
SKEKVDKGDKKEADKNEKEKADNKADKEKSLKSKEKSVMAASKNLEVTAKKEAEQKRDAPQPGVVPLSKLANRGPPSQRQAPSPKEKKQKCCTIL